MKLKFTQLTIACLYSGMLMMEPHNAVATDNGVRYGNGEAPRELKPVKGTARLISSSSRNNDAVRIYPDVLRRTMHVVAKDNEGRKIDFFVFDLEGTLIQHYKMKPKDHEKLSGLQRGKYVYHVFSGDEETATGNFEMR
jgi:hypothetical protein